MLKTVFALFLVHLNSCDASCFGKDAHFKTTDQPVVSQPSKADPTQVLVSWEKIIQRPECVDSYILHVWPEAGDPKLAIKVTVTEKKGKNVATSKTVTVQPCINYKFMVQLQESDSVTGLNNEKTGEQVFKTAATTKVPSLDKSQFRISYHWDPVLDHVDLTKADIVLDTKLITYPSCLEHIQVSGSEVVVTTGPPLTRQRSMSPSRGQALRYLNQGNGYDPLKTVNTASTLPARTSDSRGVTRGISSSISKDISRTSYPSPQFANILSRAKSQSKKVAPVKFKPPFLHANITMTLPVEDCVQYSFDIKFLAGGREVGAVTGLPLPALADQPGYTPPPLTSVLTISFSPAGKAIYAVKKSSGVTASCLPAYFEAFDSYTQRLENEVGWQAAKSLKTSQLITSSRNDLTKAQGELLKSFGCECTSPRINLTTTDANILKKSEANQLGQYRFQGVFNDKAYYLKQGVTEKDSMYLYFDSGHQQWRFTNDLGGKKKLFFATEEKTAAKCPADLAAQGHWQSATGTFGRFKKNTNVKVICDMI